MNDQLFANKFPMNLDFFEEDFIFSILKKFNSFVHLQKSNENKFELENSNGIQYQESLDLM